MMGMVNESTGNISGDFRNDFRVDQTAVSNGNPQSGSIRGEWKGESPASWRPAGILLAGFAMFVPLEHSNEAQGPTDHNADLYSV